MLLGRKLNGRETSYCIQRVEVVLETPERALTIEVKSLRDLYCHKSRLE